MVKRLAVIRFYLAFFGGFRAAGMRPPSLLFLVVLNDAPEATTRLEELLAGLLMHGRFFKLTSLLLLH